MKAGKIIYTGLIATTFMTLYSYVLSQIKDEHYREPEILGQLLHRLLPVIRKKYTKALGWNAHYFVGFLFAAVYIYLWQEKGIKPTWRNGLMLGGVSGLVAMLVWKIVLRIHPDPPPLHFDNYYKQLFPAHLVFGLVAAITNK